MTIWCRKNDRERGIEKIFEKNVNNNIRTRCVTDKYWCVLFIVALAVWLISLLHVFQHKSHYNRNSTNITTAKDDARFPYIFGKNWILDAILCNVAFLDEHYKSSGSIVIWTNVIFCGFLLLYSLLSMRTDEMFNSQLNSVVLMFLPGTLMHRFFIRSGVYSVVPFYEEIKFWVIPELIIKMILYTKKSHEVNSTRDTEDEIWPVEMFSLSAILVGPILLFASTFVFALDLHVWTITESNWDSRLLFYIIFGSSYYIILTMFYFGLMVISCSYDLGMAECDIEVRRMQDDIDCGDYIYCWRSFKIIGRYHFGTACYHATLIFPRMETFLVSINDPEVKQLPVFSKFADRLYLTQFKLHNLSLVTTAVYGSSHSESIKHLSRVFNSNLPKLEYFGGFSQATRSVLALLISTNSFMLITLWAYGLNDRRLSLISWEFYVGAMFIVNVMLKLIGVSSDAMTFYMDQIEINYPQKRWVYVDDCLIK